MKATIMLLLTLLLITTCNTAINAQFIDNFDKEKIEGWFTVTGDGDATIDFIQKEGYARMLIDATKDKHNVWWTLIKRDISGFLDLKKLKKRGYELRVEAKIRINAAPKRVNFMINTQRTTDYHEHLKEFDIPDNANWHIINMTTKNLDAVAGDSVFVQFAATDFGLGKYFVDIDYYRADIVNINKVGPDKGEPLFYHPPVREASTFSNHLGVKHDALISPGFPDINFDNYQVATDNTKVLTINTDQWAILSWDFEKQKGMKANGAGLLELTTYSVSKGGNYIAAYGKDFGEEFGKVRIIEILEGDANWKQKSVTYNGLMKGKSYEEVFNTQMIFDTEVETDRDGKNFITISRPVMQRLLDGTARGLLIRPLGVINATFYDSNQPGDKGAKLHFNLK